MYIPTCTHSEIDIPVHLSSLPVWPFNLQINLPVTALNTLTRSSLLPVTIISKS